MSLVDAVDNLNASHVCNVVPLDVNQLILKCTLFSPLMFVQVWRCVLPFHFLRQQAVASKLPGLWVPGLPLLLPLVAVVELPQVALAHPVPERGQLLPGPRPD